MPKRTLTKTKIKTRVLGMVIVGVGVIGLGVMAALVIANIQTASMPCKTDIDCANFPCEEYGPYGERQTGRCEPYQDICSCQKYCETDAECNLVCPTGSSKCDGRLCSCEDSGLEPAPPPDQSGQYISCTKDSDCTNKLVSCDKTKFNEVCGANNLCQCFAKPASAPTPTPPAPAPTLSCAKDSDCTNKIASCDKTKFNEVCGGDKICQCVVKPAPAPTPTPQTQCEDSDGGLNSGTPGCIKYLADGRVVIACDLCYSNSTSTMTEFTCTPPYDGNKVSCANSKTCKTKSISAFGKTFNAGYCQ